MERELGLVGFETLADIDDGRLCPRTRRLPLLHCRTRRDQADLLFQQASPNHKSFIMFVTKLVLPALAVAQVAFGKLDSSSIQVQVIFSVAGPPPRSAVKT
jgi:hypothetical protein